MDVWFAAIKMSPWGERAVCVFRRVTEPKEEEEGGREVGWETETGDSRRWAVFIITGWPFVTAEKEHSCRMKYMQHVKERKTWYHGARWWIWPRKTQAESAWKVGILVFWTRTSLTEYCSEHLWVALVVRLNLDGVEPEKCHFNLAHVNKLMCLSVPIQRRRSLQSSFKIYLMLSLSLRAACSNHSVSQHKVLSSSNARRWSVAIHA